MNVFIRLRIWELWSASNVYILAFGIQCQPRPRRESWVTFFFHPYWKIDLLHLSLINDTIRRSNSRNTIMSSCQMIELYATRKLVVIDTYSKASIVSKRCATNWQHVLLIIMFWISCPDSETDSVSFLYYFCLRLRPKNYCNIIIYIPPVMESFLRTDNWIDKIIVWFYETTM